MTLDQKKQASDENVFVQSIPYFFIIVVFLFFLKFYKSKNTKKENKYDSGHMDY
jgi:hypothetical protein